MKYVFNLMYCWMVISSVALNAITFNQQEFNAYAAQYGNKAANLAELRKITSVPTYFEISNNEVQEFLSKVIMPEQSVSVMQFIVQNLEKFKRIQSASTGKTLVPEAAQILARIEHAIEKAFADKVFEFGSSDRQKKFTDFLESAAKKQDLFMVRSTGLEDTKELANAGGNKSIPAIKPDPAVVSKAMGQVIASYFSEKSISQRLLAKDKTLYDPPFMPVFVQLMIGKNPISGVMFNPEAEGHTPGVTQIQATYGHGEGVVNGLVPVDTYYIGSSMLVHPLIRIKNYRMAPSADFSHLEQVANAASMAKKPCLDVEIVRELKITADTIQKYYGYAVDIEFVVQDNKIYIVQARPIVSKEKEPSYLRDELVAAAPNKISAFTIISAGGAVRIINSADELIIDDTLNKALDDYLKPDNKYEKLQAVITGQLAPATSHEATTFRGADKAVVYVSDLQAIRTLIEENKFPLLIDTQRGLIIPFAASEKFADIKSTIVANSWYVHPIPKKMSLFSQFLQVKGIQEIKPQELAPGKKTSQLIDDIKNGSTADATNALKSILARISQTIVIEQKKQREKKAVTNPALIAQLKNIFVHALSSAQEIQIALKVWDASAQKPIDRLARLYPITFFEAIIGRFQCHKNL